MKGLRLLRKPFVLGFFIGVLVLLLAEWGTLWAVARYFTRTPEQLAQKLTRPPIPSTIDVDYGMALKTLEGEAFDFAQLKGKVVFLTVWAPNCDVCKSELPSIQKLAEKAQSDNIVFVLATTRGTVQDTEAVVSEYDLTTPIYMVQGKVPGVFLTSTIPATFVIAPDGKVAFKHEGPALWDGDATVDFLHKLVPAKP